jgi:hypothetical protein
MSRGDFEKIRRSVFLSLRFIGFRASVASATKERETEREGGETNGEKMARQPNVNDRPLH